VSFLRFASGSPAPGISLIHCLRRRAAHAVLKDRPEGLFRELLPKHDAEWVCGMHLPVIVNLSPQIVSTKTGILRFGPGTFGEFSAVAIFLKTRDFGQPHENSLHAVYPLNTGHSIWFSACVAAPK
jgi:hypothetical protein